MAMNIGINYSISNGLMYWGHGVDPRLTLYTTSETPHVPLTIYVPLGLCSAQLHVMECSGPQIFTAWSVVLLRAAGAVFMWSSCIRPGRVLEENSVYLLTSTLLNSISF